MNDFLGNTLNVGDEVAFTYKNGGGLYKGCVQKITPKRVTVISWSELNFLRENGMNEAGRGHSLHPAQMIKV
jgi:hypothetical protein